MTIEVELALCLAPRQVLVWPQVLPAGACLQDAIATAIAQWQQHASSLPKELIEAMLAGPALADWQWGVWGRVLPPEHVLASGDRVEAYRPLLVDPKVARRERFAKQGARGAGLFSKKRDNAKPGY